MSTDEQLEAMEALRRGLNELPRFSFILNDKGGVGRVADRYGHWVDWQSAHELFDAEKLDWLIAKLRTSIVLARAGEGKV